MIYKVKKVKEPIYIAVIPLQSSIIHNDTMLKALDKNLLIKYIIYNIYFPWLIAKKENCSLLSALI